MDFHGVKNWRVVDPQDKFRTGDIILFSGNALTSAVIKTMTHSIWSHIGVVCWIELEYESGEKSVDMFSFELGSCDYIDLMTNEYAKLRVRLVKLSSIQNMYDIIAIRSLNLPIRTPKESRSWSRKMQKFALKHKGIPFFNMGTLITNHFIEPASSHNETTCATIAGNFLKYMGVYNHSFDTSQLNPEDFSSRKETFPGNIFAGKEIVIYKNSDKVRQRTYKIILTITILIVILITLLILIWKRKSVRAMINRRLGHDSSKG